MLEKVTWPVVALVAVILTAVVILGVFHVDTSVIINVILALGLGGGIGVLTGIRNNVNGNLTNLTNLLGEAMNKLADSVPQQPPEEK